MTRSKGLSWQKLLCMTVVASALAGCSSLSGLNPFGEKEEYLEGERKPVYQTSINTAANAAKTAKIGKPSGGNSWVQAAGPHSNNPGNVSMNVTGAVVWRKAMGGGKLNVSGFGSAPPRAAARPVSDGNRIYVYKQNGDLLALNTGGGRVFSRSLRPADESDVAAGGGAALDGGKVFVATAYRQLFALDSSGNQLWAVDLDVPVRGAPAASKGVVILVNQDNEVQAYSQVDGALQWSFAGISESAALLSSSNPAIVGNTAIIPFSSGEIAAIDIKSGEPKWIETVARSFRVRALSGLSDVSGSPVVAGNTVVATSVSGRTIAINMKSGERIWEADLGSVHTPVVSGSSVFLVGLDDTMRALDLKTGALLWTAALPKGQKDKASTNWAGPVLANGKLVAISNKGVFASVDAKTGTLETTRNISTKVFVTPIVAGGRLIVLTGDGQVAALQ
ncbi:PQQ-like beta-propeller repeat protein [Polycladidibacter hongkongensis]|uniref:PQQ-like beta-propeller repeat protein n=1 Tax=Polycladidibacter hongkongensis TaxID=1647556 RepID=UPI0008367E63|nr:PQQ-like beta-propeller repeat protein [Pseudovibrio hongkongensis]